jgi:hypothetical protein
VRVEIYTRIGGEHRYLLRRTKEWRKDQDDDSNEMLDISQKWMFRDIEARNQQRRRQGRRSVGEVRIQDGG